MKDQLKKLLGHNYDRPRISKPTSERQQKEEVYLLVAVSLLIYQTLESVKSAEGYHESYSIIMIQEVFVN